MVIGSTGLTAEDQSLLADLAAKGARIVQSPNMSVGVNLLFALSRKVASLLGEDYDIEVVEMHHNQKKDAPSGTAEKLGQILAEARGLSYEKDVRHGRVGMVGARPKNEIGMHALRGGDVVGDHTVIFATNGERIELTHKASSRQTFANGAIRAVKFLASAKPGKYDMQQVLGL
jgi:4-hydroxy-tetrahydrodipicolinate reductase